MKEHPKDPKDPTGVKVPAFTYCWMIPYLTKIGRRHGYAMCFHGSMSHDLDCVAVPWVEEANEPEELVKEILSICSGYIVKKEGEKDYGEKPHGRIAYTILFEGAWHYLDLSIIPKIKPN